MKDLKNWWYYHKNYVLLAAVLAAAAGRTIYDKAARVRPDLSVAIVSEAVIPARADAQLRSALEARCGDYNHDGKVYVQVLSYGDPDADALGVEGSAYRTATEAELIGDISSCRSYLFVTDDPVRLQRGYQLLALPDGSCPADNDYSAEGKMIPLSSVFGSSDGVDDEFLLTCSIGRRCFYNEKTCDHLEECAMLWERLTQEGTGSAADPGVLADPDGMQRDTESHALHGG